MMRSFLAWHLWVYIHAIVVGASGAAVLPREAFLFVPEPHMFGLVKLEAILSPSQDPKKLNNFDFIG